MYTPCLKDGFDVSNISSLSKQFLSISGSFLGGVVLNNFLGGVWTLTLLSAAVKMIIYIYIYKLVFLLTD